LTVIYLLVGVRLVLVGLGSKQEKGWKLYAISGGVIVHHAIFLVATDALISLDRRMAWAVVAVIAIEFCIGIMINSVPFQAKTSNERSDWRKSDGSAVEGIVGHADAIIVAPSHPA
jgi:hypothetical protein